MALPPSPRVRRHTRPVSVHERRRRRGPTDPKRTEMSTVWPVYKGTSFDIWEPDTGVYYDSAEAETMIATLQKKRLSQRRTRTSAFAEQDDDVAKDPASLPCRHARIAFRDVTNPTNTRTLLAALIPGDRVIVHQAPYLLRTAGTAVDEAYVLGVLCSMPCDWQARRTVELHMTFEQIGQLSIPDPGKGHPVRDRVVEISARLAAQDDRFSEWAAEVGVPVGSVDTGGGGAWLLAELDACVAHLYGLDEDDIAVVYDTFGRPGQWDERRDAVLVCFRRIGELWE